ncbi:unnamed protein product [Ilex paraguariensis]|uniref:Uncharacterized protein n=1 Tax=Ilex paraguariensis TaxID=185542 RepID=A0ABC8S9C1_9AQUA
METFHHSQIEKDDELALHQFDSILSLSMGEAFARHAASCVVEIEKVEKWRVALTEAGNLAGWDLQNVANG